ncbi:unnamed protein product [Moneuplotes crassus]|uniref:CRAL-TRIO domain-containing protein n=1 Tax=Euplotes crassus TaxID=5936 RepID=A0AAD2CX93_EUPCR|nr:unnamed protein product [Moneuplotes crassus]
MRCKSLKNISIVQVKQRKLLLGKNKRDTSINERISRDEYSMNLSELETERFTMRSTRLTDSDLSPSKKRKKTIKYPTLKEHPLFYDLSGSDVEKYEIFKETAHECFSNIYCEDPEVQRTCLNDITLLRFCIARNFKHKAVLKMWTKWVDWYMDYRPDLITNQEIRHLPLTKYFKIHKTDQEGRSLVVLRPGLIDENLDSDDAMLVCLYIIEKAIKKSERKADGKISVIFDRKGMSQKKDKKWLGTYKKMSQHLQDYYPERLQNAFIVNSNWVVHLIISMMKMFLSKATKDKLCIIKKNSKLLDYIDFENVPEDLQ